MRLGVIALSAALGAVVAASTFAVAPHGVAHAAVETSALRTVQPCRLADTRDGGAPPLAAGAEISLRAAGRCGIPHDASAVAVTVTAVAARGPGFATVWADGDQRPPTSLLNYAAGDTIANSGIVALGDGGRLRAYVFGRTDLIVDVTAYFARVDDSRDGRFVPTEHRRITDTRATGRPPAGSSIEVDAWMAPADATAVSVNITTTATVGPGYFTAYAAGATRPRASVMNVDAPGQTRAASAIVPVTDGRFRVHTSAGDHVVVDVTGYFTGPSAPRSSDGLFVATAPLRLLDTREHTGPSGGPRIYTGGGREIDLSGSLGEGVAAIAANVTVTLTLSAGWWRLAPAGQPDDEVSTVNAVRPNQTVANSVLSAVSTRGVAAHASVSGDVLIDVMGWFTGTPVAAPAPPPANVPTRRHVTIISDSGMAGIRWDHALGGLQGFTPIARFESCRRLVHPSCDGREGYTPRTAVEEIMALPRATTDDVLVLAVGYNDWENRFADDFVAVTGAARAKGFTHIVWTTYRESELYRLPGDVPVQFASYRAMNRIMRDMVASGAFPDVEIWDLHRYSLEATTWFEDDGVHQTPVGSWGVADWLSRHVAAVYGLPCPQPWTPNRVIDAPCGNPDPLPPTLGYPEIRQLYPVVDES